MAIGIYTIEMLVKMLPNSAIPINDPIKNLGNNDHLTLENENTMREALLAICVTPWRGIMILGLK